jgi:hypothetical protein
MATTSIAGTSPNHLIDASLGCIVNRSDFTHCLDEANNAPSPKVQDGLGDPEVIGWNCLVRYSRMVAKAA